MPQRRSDPTRLEEFDPARYRREIEQMEQRFRDRAERSGGGPVSTGEIDARVQDEMQQFFAESTMRLQEVMPQLRQGQMTLAPDSTQEIHSKIDDFFSQVSTDDLTGPGGGVAPAPAPSPASGGWDPRNAGKPKSGPMHGATAGAVRRPRAARSAAPSSGERPKMDLKTALEKLRKHGIVKDAGQPLPPPADPAPPPPPPMPERPPAPRQPPARPRTKVNIPPPRQASRTTGSQRFGGLVSKPLGAPSSRTSADPARSDPAQPSSTRPPPSRSSLPSAPRERPAAARPVDPRPSPPATHPGAGPLAVGADPGESFDKIFAEVEGLVRDTLEGSVVETFDAARAVEDEIVEAIAEAPESRPITQDSYVRNPNTPRSLSQVLPAPENDESAEEGVAAAENPDRPYDWGVERAARPPGAWLLEEGAPTRVTGAPAEPGPAARGQTFTERRPPARVEAPAPPAPSSASAPLPPPAPPSAPAPSSTPAPPSGGGGGAQSFLVRKLGDELRSFGPVVDALERRNVISADDARDFRGESAADEDDDDEVSVDSFVDDRPRGDDVAASMTPMRLVEELRRLKRLHATLLRKGIITAADLAEGAGEE